MRFAVDQFRHPAGLSGLGAPRWPAVCSQNKNDALNSLLLSGHQTAVNDILTERNQPLNEIAALMSGSQVSQPGYTNTPNTQVAGTDYAGMVQKNYNNQMKQYQADVGSNNAAMGGMFGLGGTLGSAAMKFGCR